MTTSVQRPWYKQLWPWLLMLPPAASIAGGVTMIVLATSTPSALVVDDYARIEALTEERFDRDRAAAALGLEADLRFVAAPARVEVSLTPLESAPRPRVLLLALRHATNADADLEIELMPAGDVYVAPADIPPARYHIELMPEDRGWRLGGVVSQLDAPVRLVPQAAPAVAPASTAPAASSALPASSASRGSSAAAERPASAERPGSKVDDSAERRG